MIYLTVNDAPSGVYKSQVIDVVKALNSHSSSEITLVALISFRNFSENKKKIKAWYPNAKVKRMIPGLKNWQKNTKILGLIKGIKSEPILARGPMAFYLASELNNNVSYDGRGAVKAELEEFPSMIPDKDIVQSIIAAEKQAVLSAKHRIAVSSKLVEYWKDEYSYSQDSHTIIPCTLSKSILGVTSAKKKILEELDWTEDDVILIYSGSVAGWQSFKRVGDFLKRILIRPDVKVLFMSQSAPEIHELKDQFPNQIQRVWVDHDQVSDYLSVGDYGILIRDENVTNQVASPVKFAEYLMAGLKVLISPNLGDYSELVHKEDLGIVVTAENIELPKVPEGVKQHQTTYAQSHFTKQALSKQFASLYNSISK